MKMLSVNETLKLFPAPLFRKYQKETVVKMANAFSSGIKVILLDAPTGSGKSLINATFCRVDKNFYSTPQLSLIDQIKADPYLKRGIFEEIKGRQNYTCAFDLMATVDVGVCERMREFKDCEKSVQCPYWCQKIKALNHNAVLMSFAYFVLEGRTDTPYSFGNRELCVLDESHSIDDWVVDHVSLTVSPRTIPRDLYNKVHHRIEDFRSLSQARAFLLYVANECEKYRETYVQTTLDGGQLTIQQTKSRQLAEEFVSKADKFVDSCERSEWVWQVYNIASGGEQRHVVRFSPLYAKLFMPEMIWSRAKRFIVSSATLLDPIRFVNETGLDKVWQGDEILYIKVPSTFPPENRPIIDMAVGKMTYDKKDVTIPKAIIQLERIIEMEKGKNIAVHCNSYELAGIIEEGIDPKYKDIIVAHTPDDRQEALELWKDSHGKVFLAVAFEEGQDWKGEICGAQVLMKAPYPDINDRRVARRLQLRQWQWYNFETLKKCIQMYGRAVRGPDEKKKFYVIDESFWDVVNRTWRHIPDWFKEVIPTQRRKSK